MDNSFHDKKYQLAVARDNNSRYLANSMFWRNIERIPPKHLYRPTTVEFRSVKLMILESFMVISLALLFTANVLLFYGDHVNRHATVQANFWDSGLSDVRTIDDIWDWMSDDFVPKLFAQEDSYSNMSSVVTPPYAWLNMTSEESEAYVRANGMFEVSLSNPGWKPHFLNDDPFQGGIVLGSARLRQESTVASTNCVLGDVCYFADSPENMAKEILPGTPNEILSSFKFVPSNVTQQDDGGYIFEFPTSKADCIDRIDMLKEWLWIDPATRLVVLEFTSLNSRLFTTVNHSFFFNFDGILSTWSDHVPTNLLLREITPMWFVELLTLAAFMCFALYVLGVFFKAGFLNFFEYFWNFLDVCIVCLYFTNLGISSGAIVLPSILAPVFASLPSVFMPFSTYRQNFELVQKISSILCILLWVRLFKCLLLVSAFRPVVRVFERSLPVLVLYLGKLVLAYIGLALAWTIAFSRYSNYFSSFSKSFVSLVILTLRGLDLRELFFQTDISRSLIAVLYTLFLVVAVIAVPIVCVGVFVVQYRVYRDELVVWKAEINCDKMALYPIGIDRDTFWHNDPIHVFAYTWYYKMRGFELIQETESDVGSPHEQIIDLDLLPVEIQTAWKAKKIELEDLMSHRTRRSERKGSVFGQMVTRGLTNVYARVNTIFRGKSAMAILSPTSPSRDNSRITRIQLQRLIDTEPAIIDTLAKTLHNRLSNSKIRAIDVIRKYGSVECINTRNIFEQILGRPDTSPRDVSRGLNQVISELDSAWRTHMNQIVTTCTELTIELVSLKSSLVQPATQRRRPSIQ